MSFSERGFPANGFILSWASDIRHSITILESLPISNPPETKLKADLDTCTPISMPYIYASIRPVWVQALKIWYQNPAFFRLECILPHHAITGYDSYERDGKGIWWKSSHRPIFAPPYIQRVETGWRGDMVMLVWM